MCATILDVVQSGLNWQKINRKAKEFYEDVQKDNMHILLFFIEDGMLQEQYTSHAQETRSSCRESNEAWI